MGGSTTKRIGFVGYDRIAALDLAGVMDAFSIANWQETPERYEIMVVAATEAPFKAESGLRLTPDLTFDQAPIFDTIIVPGGSGLRDPAIRAPVADWLKSRANQTRRVVSVCTGLYGLAAAGVMDGRRATTHWRYAASFARHYPAVLIEPDAIFIKDGPFYTSAGMTAGIDLALALIEEDHGPRPRPERRPPDGGLYEALRRPASVFRASPLPDPRRRPLRRSGGAHGGRPVRRLERGGDGGACGIQPPPVRPPLQSRL